MKIIRSPRRMQLQALAWRRRGLSVGFVPTMGALHEGHLALVRRARRENRIVAVSLFVNPAQFGPREDLARYPRPLARDKALCRRAGADVLFLPSAADLYPPGFDTWVSVAGLSRPLCGPFRPGHFRGVATVVAKLFNLVQPGRAYFGRKDFQQLRVVQRMAADLHMPVRVVPCPTVRGRDGLALSSRNAYLSPSERAAAVHVPLALRAAGEVIKSRPNAPSSAAVRAARAELRKIPGARVQYIRIADPETLRDLPRLRGDVLVALAVFVGRTRLIDNLLARAGKD